MLHIIQDPSNKTLHLCMEHVKPGDSLAFLGEGIECLDNEENILLIAGCKYGLTLYLIDQTAEREPPVKVYKSSISNNIITINFDIFVNLCAEAEQLKSWY